MCIFLGIGLPAIMGRALVDSIKWNTVIIELIGDDSAFITLSFPGSTNFAAFAFHCIYPNSRTLRF